MFHLNLDLVEESLDLLLLKSIPVTTNSREELIHVMRCLIQGLLEVGVGVSAPPTERTL